MEWVTDTHWENKSTCAHQVNKMTHRLENYNIYIWTVQFIFSINSTHRHVIFHIFYQSILFTDIPHDSFLWQNPCPLIPDVTHNHFPWHLSAPFLAITHSHMIPLMTLFIWHHLWPFCSDCTPNPFLLTPLIALYLWHLVTHDLPPTP